MSLFQQWAFIVKEALDKSFLVAKFFCAVHVTNTYLCSTALVQGPSMLPTFNLTNEIVLLERISTRNGKAGTGDVVVLRSPENPRKFVTKRIIGMEGDNITYIVDPKNSDRTETIIVPKGHVWVQGDNIYNSYDSRNFGPVPYGLLQGKVFWRIWPASVFGSIARRPETVDPALKLTFHNLENANIYLHVLKGATLGVAAISYGSGLGAAEPVMTCSMVHSSYLHSWIYRAFGWHFLFTIL